MIDSMQLKIGAAAVAAVVCFSAGWSVNGWRYEAKISEQLQEQQDQKAQADKLARKLSEELQLEKATNQKLYDELKRRTVNVTDNRICFANHDALQLWNQALSGSTDVSSATSRAPSSSRGTSTATDRELLENQIENARRWKNLRDQVNKLREWDRETFD